MEAQGLTVSRQDYFDRGGRDDGEIVRAAEDLASQTIALIAAVSEEARNDLKDMVETGVDLWVAMEELGIVKLAKTDHQAATEVFCPCRECKRDGAHRAPYDPTRPFREEEITGLMRASVQPDRRGSRSRSKSAKKSAGPYASTEQPMLTSYAWKLKSA